MISGGYEAVKFYPFWTFEIYQVQVLNPDTGEYETVDNVFNNVILSILMYIIQVTGNKPVSILVNLLMGIALSGHPFTLPTAVYYFAQLPFDSFLEYLVYPIFPQTESPFAHKWLLQAFFGVQDNN